MREVVKKEVVKLLDAGIIYLISDSEWVSPIQVIPKKDVMIVIKNEHDELNLTRIVTRQHICIDYRRLNQATWKDHFPLPFINQMLKRPARNSFFCYVGGCSNFFQISIHPSD